MWHMGLEQFVRQHKMWTQARELIRCRGLWIQFPQNVVSNLKAMCIGTAGSSKCAWIDMTALAGENLGALLCWKFGWGFVGGNQQSQRCPHANHICWFNVDFAELLGDDPSCQCSQFVEQTLKSLLFSKAVVYWILQLEKESIHL